MNSQSSDASILSSLSEELLQVTPLSVEKLPAHASNRQYFRLKLPKSTSNDVTSIVGTVGSNIAENKAFIAFAEHFKKLSQPVPIVYSSEKYPNAYLQQDLGDRSLYSVRITADKETWQDYYKKAVQTLAELQVKGFKDFPTSHMLSRKNYDSVAMRWDLDGFKYLLLRSLDISFQEDKLEDAFAVLLSHLASAQQNRFMHRDYQSRNIIIHNDSPYIIDFQGGRFGPPQYDLVSLLFQGSVKLSEEERERFLHHYIETLKTIDPGSQNSFLEQYYYFVMLFLIKVLGTYGLRGVIEGKLYFLQSIPLAIENLLGLEKLSLDSGCSYFFELCKKIEERTASWQMSDSSQKTLLVSVKSFSYRNGHLSNNPLHGGGFVFDCRGLPNPHHDETLRPWTGRDLPVQTFFKQRAEAEEYYQSSKQLIMQMIQQYQSKGYTSLSVAFGCTGGKHRSVYMAERLSKELQAHNDIKVELSHRELD